MRRMNESILKKLAFVVKFSLIIPVNLKKKLSSKDHVYFELVRRAEVKIILKYLQRVISLYHESIKHLVLHVNGLRFEVLLILQN